MDQPAQVPTRHFLGRASADDWEFSRRDEVPPSEWIAALLTTRLGREVPEHVCVLPYVRSTAHLRFRYENFEEAFFRSMQKLAKRLSTGVDFGLLALDAKKLNDVIAAELRLKKQKCL